MNREECESKILEKLKEVRALLNMCIIGDNYITFNNSFNNSSEEFPLDVTLIDEEVYHFGN